MREGSSPDRPFVLCADDYGLAPGVSQGILTLIRMGRVSATGCMVTMPHWPLQAAALAEIADRADIGLHLTLTDQPALGRVPRLAPGGRLPPLGRLMARAAARRLDPGELAAEIGAQFEAFVAATGRLPDFVDGHQHVHQLPQIRDAVLDLFRDRLPGAWLRLCNEPAAAIWARGVDRFRAGVIAALGRELARRAAQAAIPVNDSFRGVHDFSGRQGCGALFERFLTGPGRRVLVMCHPGHPDDALRAVDRLTDWRGVEFAWLAGDGFATTLARLGMRPARFRDLG